VLAGSQSFKTKTGDPVATVSETVWCTEVGKWDVFSSETGVNPDDSIEFTAVYRSPIQWVYGQKTLLIGALEFEYSASGEGIFSPGDLGVFLHSTHGSTNVQPAGFGEAVLFPSDGGTKVRRMEYRDTSEGWVSEDVTLLNPDVCFPRIRRMVRVRNPHQQCWCLNDNGTVSIFHSESGLNGWSTFELNGGKIRDICVLTSDDGFDVPYMTVERNINGSGVLYIEAIANWTESRRWDYTGATKAYQFTSPTDTIPDLTHLEGQRVQVYDQYNYYGLYTVEGGQVVLTNDAGGSRLVTTAIVGISHWSTLRTLPPEKQDPGAPSRYTDFNLRVLASTAPRINGERPAERRVVDSLDSSPSPYGFRGAPTKDIGVYLDGWQPTISIEIEEQLPLRTEVLGLWGKLKTGSL